MNTNNNEKSQVEPTQSDLCDAIAAFEKRSQEVMFGRGSQAFIDGYMTRAAQARADCAMDKTAPKVTIEFFRADGDGKPMKFDEVNSAQAAAGEITQQRRNRLLTWENMSPELKRELEQIESNEYELDVSEYVREAFKHVAYLHATMGPTSHPHNAQDTNPFEVEFYWDSPLFGSMEKFDLRKDLLERFSDDPDVYREVITTAEKAMRDFADELGALLRKPAE